MKTTKQIFTLLMISFFIINVNGQEIGKILSPNPNDTLLNGELFIVIDIDPTLNIKPAKLNLTIDKLNYSTLIKLSNNKITALILKPMKQGQHEIVLKYYLDNNEHLKQKWTFFTYNENKMKKKFPDQWNKHKQEKKTFEVKGSLSLSSKISDLSGEGAYLRQEPPQSLHVRADATIRYKKISFPFKIYYTNHENPLLPPRNRLMFGITGEKAGILIGDVNPSYDRLLLKGSRIRGAEAYVKFKNTKISIVHGEVNRKNEGRREYWDINQGFQPVNIQQDSSYVLPGTYKRNLSAFNIEMSPANSGNTVKFTILRSTDDVASIQYGGPAQQNLAGSLNSIIEGRNRRFRCDIGVSISATTREIRRGAISPEEYQSTYKAELRVNPKGWENFFIVNLTTVPLSTKNATFLGMYANMRFNILKQSITVNLQRLGSTFESFGNPYLQNDRRNILIKDCIPIWKSRINLMFQYRYNEDNLSGIKGQTNITHMAGSNLSLSFGQKIPKIKGGYRLYIREGISVKESFMVQEIHVTNYNAGISHIFKTGNFTHGFNIVFNRNIRECFLPRTYRNDNDVINFSISENILNRINLSLNYNHLLLANDTSSLTEQQMLGFIISYSTKNKKLKISVRGNQISSLKTEFYPESTRQNCSVDVQYNFFKNAIIKVQVGNSTYIEPVSGGKNYNENWAQLSLRYSLR